jgi:hypothetical protein
MVTAFFQNGDRINRASGCGTPLECLRNWLPERLWRIS